VTSNNKTEPISLNPSRVIGSASWRLALLQLTY
jgi:hypothetical protein